MVATTLAEVVEGFSEAGEEDDDDLRSVHGLSGDEAQVVGATLAAEVFRGRTISKVWGKDKRSRSVF